VSQPSDLAAFQGKALLAGAPERHRRSYPPLPDIGDSYHNFKE
jgi:hypothetical protein